MKSAIERRLEILEIISQQGKARVEDLAELFGVSTVTIRSDLSFLEKKGHVVRSHGSAISNHGMIAELSVQEKRCFNAGIKSVLGAAAANLIEDGQAIILDSGSTIREMAANLNPAYHGVVMTNGLDIALELSSLENVEVLMTGGVLRSNALSFVGAQAENGLKNYRFNKVFLGVDGFDLRAGITTHNEQEASLNRLMCEVSDEVIAIADSSKFGKRSCHMICECSKIDTLITDSGIPEEYLEHLKNTKVNVIIVDE